MREASDWLSGWVKWVSERATHHSTTQQNTVRHISKYRIHCTLARHAHRILHPTRDTEHKIHDTTPHHRIVRDFSQSSDSHEHSERISTTISSIKGPRKWIDHRFEHEENNNKSD